MKYLKTLFFTLACILGLSAKGYSTENITRVENTLSQDFLESLSPLDGRVFYGKQKDGSECSVYVRLTIVGDEKSQEVYQMPVHRRAVVIGSSTIFNEEIRDLESYDDIMAYTYRASEGNRFSASAGWCSHCAARKLDGKLEGWGGSTLSFYAAGETPQYTYAKIKTKNSGEAIDSVEFYQHSNWYIPVINFSPSSVSFSCNIGE